jgi:hypothetical protein
MKEGPGRAPGANKDNGTNAGRLIRWAAILSILALVAHGIDAPDHIREWWVYSTYFVTAGSFQFFYGLGLFLQSWRYDDTGAERNNSEQYGRAYYILGLILTGSIVILYIITRTTGMPFFGPEAASEPVTALSLVPIAVDIPVLYCLGALLYHTRQTEHAGLSASS